MCKWLQGKSTANTVRLSPALENTAKLKRIMNSRRFQEKLMETLARFVITLCFPDGKLSEWQLRSPFNLSKSFFGMR